MVPRGARPRRSARPAFVPASAGGTTPTSDRGARRQPGAGPERPFSREFSQGQIALQVTRVVVRLVVLARAPVRSVVDAHAAVPLIVVQARPRAAAGALEQPFPLPVALHSSVAG